jgi:uncharacterized protein
MNISQYGDTETTTKGVMMRLLKILLLVLYFFAVLPALAQNGYPEPQDLFVNDFADILNSDTAASLTAMLENLRSTEGIEMTVVTIGSIHDYPVDANSLEEFATGLFNTWGIGSADEANGILLLVAVNDRRVRIEVGRSYENALNDEMQMVIDTFILPAFRQNEYNAGIYEGARNIILQVTGTLPADTRPFNFGVWLAGVIGAILSPVGIIILLVVGYFLLLIRRFRRGEPLFVSGNASYSGYDSSSSNSSWSSGDSGGSSSGADFGGGDSSGGGASGDW